MLNALVKAVRGRPKKKIGECNRWHDIGGVDGYIAALNTLGDDYMQMEKQGSSALDINGIWGRLAVALRLENHDEDTRKWLKLVWKDDRRKVRSVFYASKIDEIQSTKNGDEKMNDIQLTLPDSNTESPSKSSSETSSSSSSAASSSGLSSSSSKCASKVRQCKVIPSSIIPCTMLFFALSYDAWKKFFNEEPDHWGLKSDWTNKLSRYLAGINITCVLVFKYHHVKQRESRKRRLPVFRCTAYCKHQECPVNVEVTVKHLPEKDEQTVFCVEKFGTENHDVTDKTIRRQLTGKDRERQSMYQSQII